MLAGNKPRISRKYRAGGGQMRSGRLGEKPAACELSGVGDKGTGFANGFRPPGGVLLLEPIPVLLHAAAGRGMAPCGVEAFASKRAAAQLLFALGEGTFVRKFLGFCCGGTDAGSHDQSYGG